MNQNETESAGEVETRRSIWLSQREEKTRLSKHILLEL